MAFYLEHRLGVSAPPEVIWEILRDVEGWNLWSPIYTTSSGTLRIGAPVTLDLALEDQPPERIEATVIDWAPEIQIHLGVKFYGGLMTTVRYFEIEKLTKTGCIFSNGEVFRGPLAGFMPRKLRWSLRRGFASFSEALKLTAEAAWRAQSAEPI